MAEPVGKLAVKVTADTTQLRAKLEDARRRVRRFSDGVDKASKTVLKFGAAGATMAAAFAVPKLIAVSRQFDVLNAQLVTATGSAAGAEKAFGAIERFAAATPFDLAQVTTAFTKLVNLGLTPSEKALTSYGNTASAMGKSLDQMIEAVADAATGEFERLKEFGIKASKQGDRVKFMFRGVATEVGNNSAEIEKYLQGLGEVEFAGAMAERVKTLDGALSNLGDSFDGLFRDISSAGAGDLIEQIVRGAITSLDDLRDNIKSGEIPESIDALGSNFDGFARDVERSLNSINRMMAESSDFWVDAADVGGAIGDSLADLPQDLRAMIQLLATELGFIGTYAEAEIEGFIKVVTTQLASLVDKAGVVGKAMAKKLNPFSGSFDMSASIEAEFARIDTVTGESTDTYITQQRARAKAAVDARRDSITWVMAERDADIKASESKLDAAQELTEEFRKQRDERNKAAAGTDALLDASGGKKGGTDKGPTDADKKRVAALRGRYKTEATIKGEHLQRLADLETLFAQEGYASEREKHQIIAAENKRFAKEIAGIRARGFDSAQAAEWLQGVSAAVSGAAAIAAGADFDLFKTSPTAGVADSVDELNAWAEQVKRVSAEVSSAFGAGGAELPTDSRAAKLKEQFEAEAALKVAHLEQVAAIEREFGDGIIRSDAERKARLLKAEQDHAAKLNEARKTGYSVEGVQAWAAEMEGAAARVAASMMGAEGGTDKESRLESLRGQYETEASLKAAHLQKLADLETLFAETGFATDAERKAIVAEAEQQHADRIASIRQRGLSAVEKFTAMSSKAQAQHVLGSLQDTLAGASSHSKKAFKLQKTAAISSALISAYDGISKTMAAYPYPVNVGMAAAHAAGAFAQVNSIRSQSFGGGGAGGGAALGGGATPAALPSAGGGSGVTIDVESISPDAILTGSSVIALGRRMQEAMDDGAFTLRVQT